MTIVTNKGNFGSFQDLLLDMKHENYNEVLIKDIQAICNQIHLGGIVGTQTKTDIEKIVEQL